MSTNVVYRADKGMLEHHYFMLWCANSGIKDTVEGKKPTQKFRYREIKKYFYLCLQFNFSGCSNNMV